jgi:hypothetical protein
MKQVLTQPSVKNCRTAAVTVRSKQQQSTQVNMHQHTAAVRVEGMQRNCAAVAVQRTQAFPLMCTGLLAC